jgi:diaminopimelate decarboxylase
MTRSSDVRPHWSTAIRDYDCLSVRDGVLHIEGVNTVDLADEYGTPLFVFSEAQIRQNLRRFREAFSKG